MPETLQMCIKEVFFLRDGRTVLTGPVEGGEKAIVEPGLCQVLVDGAKVATIRIEPEMIASRALPLERLEMRSVSTRDPTGLTKELVASRDCRLEGAMRVYGHRHLVGIDSPPSDFVPDDMTLGPRLPEGWDGDAWIRPGGDGYFLRAWNKALARYAIGMDVKYEEARRKLVDEIATGGRGVEIHATERRGN